VAYARILAGVPDFAPDGYMVRTIADDLEQMALGPNPTAPTTDVGKRQLKADVADILRRALETVRQMNTMVQNGDQGVGGVDRNFNNMAGQQAGSYGRTFEPFYVGGQHLYGYAVERHASVLQEILNSDSLEGYFHYLDRLRPFSEVADLSTLARRRMPAMMRGSDGLELSLTRRQLRKLALAAPPAPDVVRPTALVPSAAPAVAGLTRLRTLLPGTTHSVTPAAEERIASQVLPTGVPEGVSEP
jgi:hypothetical protein